MGFLDIRKSGLYLISHSKRKTIFTNTTIIDEDLSSPPSPPTLLTGSKSSPAVCRSKSISSSTTPSPVQGTEVFSPRPITRSCFANLDNPRKDFVLQPNTFPPNTDVSAACGHLKLQGSGHGRIPAPARAPVPLPFPRPPLPPLPTEIDSRPRAGRKGSQPRLSKSTSLLPKVTFSSAFISELPVHTAGTELTTVTELCPRPSRPGSRFQSRPHSHSRYRPLSANEQKNHKVRTIRKTDLGWMGWSPNLKEQPGDRKIKKDGWTSSVGRFAGRFGLARRD
ncbi:hypothetical protein [Phaffia rhodozyma]|uniref:Uncharacterized protein n=1 Tax=Phaffia rhodozyma TaxID=264483 RepID=A0A0F7SE62_PHARH|nr:hypothetical protein [Phaffia rhodozyma]